MLQVMMRRRGKRFLLNMTGHATGNPEACAAASALVSALAGYAVNAERYGMLKLHCCKLEDGSASVEFSTFEQRQREVAAAWLVAEIGFRQLAEGAPEYVSVIIL